DRANKLVREVAYSLDDFKVDNCERNRTTLEGKDLLPENARDLAGKVRDIIGRERFEILDLSGKLALEAEMRGEEKAEGQGRREAQGTRYSVLRGFDVFSGILTFTEEDEDEDGADAASVPKPGDYLVPVRAGELAQIHRMRAAYDAIREGKLFNTSLASCLYSGRAARSASIPADASDRMAGIKRNLLQRNINDEQFRAVLKALFAPDLALIQGPPGTGKTTVIAEIIHQALAENPKARILLASQSHLAVDNALEKLRGDPNMRPIRIASSSEARSSLEEEGEQYLESEIDAWVERAGASGSWSPRDNAVARSYWERLQALPAGGTDDWTSRYREKAQRELSRSDRELLRDNYIARVNVVAATCSECGRRNFKERWVGERGFDYVIIDEVSKASPPELFVPLVHARKVILIGDHRQLPPMIDEDLIEQRLVEAGMSDIEGKIEAMKESLFERLFSTAHESIRETLKTQYRMHESIQDAIEQFYQAEGGLRLGLPREAMNAPDLENAA
ncbi:MAG: AAA family ATPase, partial [Spirochaetaceae bacterium]|nr:AAA family ATPase [Spirochaetaceae bacterium]